MATYCILSGGTRTTGVSTSTSFPSSSWPKNDCYGSIKSCIDEIRANGSGSNTILVAKNSFKSANDYFYLDSSKFANLSVIGEDRENSEINPSVSVNTVSVISALATPVNFTNIRLVNNTTGYNIFSKSVNAQNTLSNCLLESGPLHAAHGVSLSSGTTNIVDGTEIRHKGSSSGVHSIFVDSTAIVTINNSFVRPGLYSHFSGRVFTQATFAGSLNINNSVIIGGASHQITSQGTGNINIKNSLIGPPVIDAYGINITGSTVSVQNSDIHSTMLAGHANTNFISGSIGTDSNNIKDNSAPRIINHARGGAIIVTVDDGTSTSWATANLLEGKFSQKGWGISYVVSQHDWETSGARDDIGLKAMNSRGTVDVGVHTYSHGSLGILATDTIFTVTKPGETITIDRNGDTITVSNTVTISPFKSLTLDQIKSALVAAGCTVSAYSGVVGSTLGESIADSAGAVASPSPIKPLIDVTGNTGYYKVELKDVKTWLSNLLGTTVYTLAGPSNSYTAQAKSAALNLGFLCYRNSQYSASPGYSKVSTLDIDSFSIPSFDSVTYLKGSTDDITRMKARALAFFVAEYGFVCGVYCHNYTGTAPDSNPLTSNDWDIIIDEWSKFSSFIKIISLKTFANLIRTSRWTNNGDGTFSIKNASGVVAYDCGYSNFRLTPLSPYIGAGIVVSGVTKDADSNPLPGPCGYSIGPYEYMSQVDSGYSPWALLGTMPALTVGAGAGTVSSVKVQ